MKTQLYVGAVVQRDGEVLLVRRFFSGTLTVTRADGTNPLQRSGSFL